MVTIIIFTQTKQVCTVHTAYVNYTRLDLLVCLHIRSWILGFAVDFKLPWITFKGFAHLNIITYLHDYLVSLMCLHELLPAKRRLKSSKDMKCPSGAGPYS